MEEFSSDAATFCLLHLSYGMFYSHRHTDPSFLTHWKNCEFLIIPISSTLVSFEGLTPMNSSVICIKAHFSITSGTVSVWGPCSIKLWTIQIVSLTLGGEHSVCLYSRLRYKSEDFLRINSCGNVQDFIVCSCLLSHTKITPRRYNSELAQHDQHFTFNPVIRQFFFYWNPYK